MTTPSHIGQYRILKKIGAGGMGLVFLGEHTLLGRRAAIKTLLPTVAVNHEIVERFFNEARATSSIADPGVIQIFDFGYHVDGTAYIVMELLEGEALSARIARLGRLSLGDALRFARQIAGSLAAAHARDIIHRDLKPENIFLVRDAEAQGGERIKIIDFGVCKVGAGDPVLTEVGAMIGTPVYMSPEQCRGTGAVDQRSDIYSFGCLVFHMITGRPPFVGDASGDLIVAHLQTEPPPPSQIVSELPPAIDALVLRCLAKSPADRFASMTELSAVLGELAVQPEAPVTPVTPPPATVPLGQGFRSVYDANMAARFGSAFASRFGTPRSAVVPPPRLNFGSTPSEPAFAGRRFGGTPEPADEPVDEDLDAPPPRAGMRAVLACVLVVGATLGLVVTPLVLDDAEHPAAAGAPRPVTLPVESATEAIAPVSSSERALPTATLTIPARDRKSTTPDEKSDEASGEASSEASGGTSRSGSAARGSREAAYAAAVNRRGRSAEVPSSAIRAARSINASSTTSSSASASRPVTSPAEVSAPSPRASSPPPLASAPSRTSSAIISSLPAPSAAPAPAAPASTPSAAPARPTDPAPRSAAAPSAPPAASTQAPAPTEDLYDTR